MKNISSLFIISFILLVACNSKNTNPPKDLSKTDFVYLDGKKFKHKGNDFFPVMLNYVVCFRNIENEFLLSPIKEYENPFEFEGNSKDSLELQLRGHLQLIKEMGFNSIRLVFDRTTAEESKYFYGADQQKLYIGKDNAIILNGLEKFLKIVAAFDVKIMLLIKAPVENKELEDFTALLLKKFEKNSTIFAYDFFNEPLYFDENKSAHPINSRKKEEAFSIVSKWKKMMRTNAPNQLFTIGFAEPIEVLEWDPELLPVDFIAFHPYHPLRVANEIYWYSKYTTKPWMIGETALSADGDSISYDEQRQFMKETYRRIIDCGGSGIGWWEFQEMPLGNFDAKYTGILNHKGFTKTKDGKYTIQGTVKPVAREIARFRDYQSNSPCNCSSNYYNILGYNNIVLTGSVVNRIDNKPIEGAVIRGWNEYWNVGMNTFTNEKGEFTLYSNDECVHFEISAPKMSKIKFDFKTQYFPLTSDRKYTMQSLPDKDLESQQISYKEFLLHKNPPDSADTDFYIYNFDSTKFNKAKFIGSMGIKKLAPLSL